MTDIPPGAIEAAADAIMSAGNFNDDEPERFEARTLARAALEAATPLLAEAWGVAEHDRQSEQLYAEYAKAMRELREDGWQPETGGG